MANKVGVKFKVGVPPGGAKVPAPAAGGPGAPVASEAPVPAAPPALPAAPGSAANVQAQGPKAVPAAGVAPLPPGVPMDAGEPPALGNQALGQAPDAGALAAAPALVADQARLEAIEADEQAMADYQALVAAAPAPAGDGQAAAAPDAAGAMVVAPLVAGPGAAPLAAAAAPAAAAALSGPVAPGMGPVAPALNFPHGKDAGKEDHNRRIPIPTDHFDEIMRQEANAEASTEDDSHAAFGDRVAKMAGYKHNGKGIPRWDTYWGKLSNEKGHFARPLVIGASLMKYGPLSHALIQTIGLMEDAPKIVHIRPLRKLLEAIGAKNTASAAGLSRTHEGLKHAFKQTSTQPLRDLVNDDIGAREVFAWIIAVHMVAYFPEGPLSIRQWIWFLMMNVSHEQRCGMTVDLIIAGAADSVPDQWRIIHKKLSYLDPDSRRDHSAMLEFVNFDAWYNTPVATTPIRPIGGSATATPRAATTPAVRRSFRDAPMLNVSGYNHDKDRALARGYCCYCGNLYTPEHEAKPFDYAHCGAYRVHPRYLERCRWRLVVEILAGRQQAQPPSERWDS